MLSSDTESRLARIFLTLASGEKDIENSRRALTTNNSSSNHDYNPVLILLYLDSERKNRIEASDIRNYLCSKGISITPKEADLIILFYDSNFDGALDYNELLFLLQNEIKKEEIIKNPLEMDFEVNPEEINNFPGNIDYLLTKLLEKETELAREILILLDDIKRRYDYKIHSLYHACKGEDCIDITSLKKFFDRVKSSPLDSDLSKIMRRLDLNKDGKVDLVDFHAFLSFPRCKYSCQCEPCPECGTECCHSCVSDVSCYKHNIIHHCYHPVTDPSNFHHLQPHYKKEEDPNEQENRIFNSNPTHNEHDPKKHKGKQEPFIYKNYIKDPGDDPHGWEKKINKNYFPDPNDFIDNSQIPGVPLVSLERPAHCQIQVPYPMPCPVPCPPPEEIKVIERPCEQISDSLNLRLSPCRRNYSPIHMVPPPPIYSSSVPCVTQSPVHRSPHGSPHLSPSHSPSGRLCNLCHAYPCVCDCEVDEYVCPICNCTHSASFHHKKGTSLSPPPLNTVPMCDNICDVCHYNPCRCPIYCAPPESPFCCEVCSCNPCKCCSVCLCFPCRCCVQCHQAHCKCCRFCHHFPCICCPTCRNYPCICCPTCKNYPCKCCSCCHSGQCKCCFECGQYPCVCCPICHVPKDRCTCCPHCHSFPCKCCKVCHQTPCQCCPDCGCNPCRCCPHCVNLPCGCHNSKNPKNKKPKKKKSKKLSGDRKNPGGGSCNGDNCPINKNPSHSDNDSDEEDEDPHSLGCPNNKNKNCPKCNPCAFHRHAHLGCSHPRPILGVPSVDPANIKDGTDFWTQLPDVLFSRGSGCEDEEQYFVNLLQKIMYVESQLEKEKINLAKKGDFNVEDVFRIFDREGKDYLTDNDLKEGLNTLSIEPTENDMKLLKKRYDLTNKGCISYSDFFDMLVPFEREFRAMVENRKPNSCCPANAPNVFSDETLYTLTNLIKLMINYERKLNDLKKDRGMMKLTKKLDSVFGILDYLKKGVFEINDLHIYVKRHEIFTNDKDFDLLFIRLDRNRNGKIDYGEIKIDIEPIK